MSQSARAAAAWLVVSLLCTPPPAAGGQTEGEKLHQILRDQWEWQLAEFPFMATFTGDARYADQLPDMSLEAIERRRAHAHEVKARIEAIDFAALSEDDKLNYDLFLLNTEQEIEGQRFRDDLMPINQMGGLHAQIAQLAQISPKLSVKHVEDLTMRLARLPTLVDQIIVIMQKGLELGLTPPKITLRDVQSQMDAQITEDPKQSPVFTAAFGSLPSSISDGEQQRLRAEGEQVVAEAVIPALKKLRAFWVDEYYPRCREEIGLSALPDGLAWYDYNVKVQTSTSLTAEEIHQIGLDEVERIRGEMEAVKEQAGFEGSLSAFFEFLRTDPQFFFAEAETLLTAYRDIAKRIDPELVKLFGTLPRLPYGVVPVPKHIEKSQTTAYYMPGNLAAGRPGYFYANTYDLASRPKWEMEALTAHEAVPGHHLQVAIAQELEDVPRFRRFGGYTAYVEGWGLYSESLGQDLGLYEDPYSKFGQLTYEMWRAIRLVADTGIHAKGWTRQQAIDFFLANAGKTEHDVVVEVDRYIVMPGQALAYKIGELKLKELRRTASEVLGEAFDLRAFHDMLLGAGALPLNVLEKRVAAWIDERKVGS